MLLRLWDFPGKTTGVGCHFLLQRIFPSQGSNLGLPHCRQMLYHLSQQGNPYICLRLGLSLHPPAIVNKRTIYQESMKQSIEIGNRIPNNNLVSAIFFQTEMKMQNIQFVHFFTSVQLLNRARLFETPWIAAHQASLAITISRSSLRL